MISEIGNRKRTEKPLGVYLVEAGIVTPDQVKIALNEQKLSQKQRLGEILASHGWVEQQTIEYLVDKVILPERQTIEQLAYTQIHQSDRSQLNPTNRANAESYAVQQLPSSVRELRFSLSPSRLTRFLLVFVFSLVAISFLLKFSVYFLPDYPLRDTLIPLFDINQEQNIPSLYSWSALLFSAMLLAAIARVKKIVGDRYVTHWRALSIIFVYLSLDEAMSLHEKFVDPWRARFNTGGIFYYAWVIPASILVVIFGLTFIRFLLALPPKTKRLFAIAATVYVAGALGLEMVAGIYAEVHGSDNIVIAALTSIEEFMEMSGIVIFIYALLTYINTYLKGWSVKIDCPNKLDRSA